MNAKEKLSLQKLISENDVVETTDLIRQVRHSSLIREDVKMLNHLKKQNSSLMVEDPDEFDNLCISECFFLFNNYTDLFNKVKKDEIDLEILNQFLSILEQIEQGTIDQHQGSFEVGKILKKLYIDSALKKADKINQGVSNESEMKKKEHRNISWSQFKMRK